MSAQRYGTGPWQTNPRPVHGAPGVPVASARGAEYPAEYADYDYGEYAPEYVERPPERPAERPPAKRAAAPKPAVRPVRWSPLAYSVVIGLCAGSAALWVIVVAVMVVMVGNLLHTQAEIMLKLNEITLIPPAGAP